MNKLKCKKLRRNNSGITLVALVVTIIVLIILTGLSNALLLGKNGIITKAEEAKEQQKIAELSEKLELVKAPTQVDKLNTIITVDEYLEELQKPNMVDFSIDEIERVNEDNAYVTVADGYEFLIEYREDNTLIITYQGKVKNLKPRITKLELKNTTNSITAKIEAKRAEKYKFYIKDKLEGEYEYKEENKKGEYTYSNLEQNKEYYIKIEAINKNGQVESEVKRKTGGMPVLTVGELISTTTPEGWVNTNKTTKIEIRTDKDITGVILQYTKLPENATTEDYKKAQWTNYGSNGIESEQNETIAIRLWDGTNETSRMAVKVEKIDKIKPVITSATANTNTITIKATDEASGIIGYTVTENIADPTNFTSCTSTKSLSIDVGNKTQGKTYYVWVKDEAGNVSAYKQVGTTSVTPSVGNITFGTTNWKDGKVSTTISTTSSYTIKYQKNSTSGAWTTIANGGVVSNLLHGDKIYAKLVDSTEQSTGNYATLEIKDTTLPNNATITISGTTTQPSLPATLNVKVTHTDNESGIAINSCKYVLTANSSEIGTNASSYTGGKFSSNGETITVSPNAVGDWYLHVLSVDNAGKAKETIKGPITITTKYHEHTNSLGESITDTTIYSTATIGGCYQASGHTHNKTGTCSTSTYTGIWKAVSQGGVYAKDSGCSKCDNGYWIASVTWRCTYCGTTSQELEHVKGSIVGNSRGTHCGPYTKYTCSSENNTWNVGCGKTTSTIEGYTITYP